MVTTKRRERQKIETRDGILNAARQIARQEGWGAVTIRRIADAIEYTPPIVYEYFAGKDALMEELQAQGFARLADEMQLVLSAEANARQRLLKAGGAYINFAYAEPELYQLMHGWNSAAVPLDTTLFQATRVGDLVESCLKDWAAAQDITLADPASAVEMIWGLLHGLVSVEMLGRIGGGQEQVKRLAAQGMAAFLAAWTA